MGDVRAVRSGIGDNNDLIWIGKAASFSTKLSNVRVVGYNTYISTRVYTKLVYTKLRDGAKIDGRGKNMWESSVFYFAGERETVYKSNQWKKP